MDKLVTTYLNRIDYRGDLSPTAAVLRDLQRAHLYAVYFENLDIGWSVPIRLDFESMYAKIVERGRGGCCYELNGLFGWLLRELGFQVADLSASDIRSEGEYGPLFDHLVLRVTCPADDTSDVTFADDQNAVLEASWLADVGWGDTFMNPLRLIPNLEQQEGQRTFWLEPRGERLVLHMRDWDGYEESQYALTLDEYPFEAFFAMNQWHQTSPESSFGTNRVISQPTATGRRTLRNNRCILTDGKTRTVTEFSEEEFPALVSRLFGVESPA